MLVSSIIDQIKEMTGICDNSQNFQILSRAVELLANEGLFDPLVGYLDFSNSETNLVTLPRDVKTVLRVTINSNPTFARSRFFEFTLNTDGSGDGEEVGFSWSDRLYLPVQDERKLPGVGIYLCENAADAGKTITLIGRDVDGTEIREVIAASVDGTAGAIAFYEITRVLRDETEGICLLYCEAVEDDKLMSQYYPDETNPYYRVIKLSRTVCSVRIMFRREVFEITSLTDIIPLQSKMAVIHAAKAVRYYAIDEYDKGDAALARAVDFIKKEQAARDESNSIAAALEKPTTINRLSYNVAEGLTVADVYDDAAEIFGLVGRAKLFERIGDAVQFLANKGQWDSMTGMVRISADFNHNGVVSRPRFVGNPLAVNIDMAPAFARSRLFEYSLNTNGEEDGEIVGYSFALGDECPLMRDPASPTVLTVAGDAGDAALALTFYGLDDQQGGF
jgi:hypothetical protein